MTFLVKNGAAVNAEIGTDSPLHFAVASGLRRTIEFLIEKGANINHVGKDDITPLMNYISKNGNLNYSIINILLSPNFVEFDVELLT